jgi:[methyl-Co(III) methanol-specific corrinoid protein]:coenzyme M methyltransferase
MTSRERFLTVLHGQRPDRAPVGHISALTCAELQDQTGCQMPQVHHDPEALARLSAANHEVLGFDFVTCLINYFNEPAALGCEMDWGTPAKYPMYLSHPWQPLLNADAPEALDTRPPHDWLDRPHLQCCLETIRVARRLYGQRLGLLGKIMGPLSMVQVMCGVEETMMALVEEPQRIAALLNKAAALLVPFANAQLRAGADAIAIGEGGAGANMLSPDMYRTALMGVHQRLIAAIEGPTVMHICGDITPRLESLGQIGLDFFHFDWAIDPRAMVAAAQGKFRLIGNASTGDLMNAAPEVIRKQVFACLDAGVDMIAPGCATAPTCPLANLAELARATRDWRPS